LVPGVPAVLVGSNGHVAWGLTRMSGDSLDLVRVSTHPDHPGQYRTAQGWQRFDEQEEEIRVKGSPAVRLRTKHTCWGPVMPEPLLGDEVALRWTALDPGGVDFGLLDLQLATTLEDAVRVVQRAAIPPLNVLLADARGCIAWALGGRFPVRRGLDGATAQSWIEAGTGWSGVIPPEALPRLIDPPAGFLVAANNRTLGPGCPDIRECNYDNGYRANQVAERLWNMQKAT